MACQRINVVLGGSTGSPFSVTIGTPAINVTVKEPDVRATAVTITQKTFMVEICEPILVAPTEEEIVFANKNDTQDLGDCGCVTYLGAAVVGANTSAAVWRIRRLVFDPTVSPTPVQTYADGDIEFNNVWDDRATLTYSEISS